MRHVSGARLAPPTSQLGAWAASRTALRCLLEKTEVLTIWALLWLNEACTGTDTLWLLTLCFLTLHSNWICGGF